MILLILQEVEFIWKAPRNLMGQCMLIYRYATIAGLSLAIVIGKSSGVHFPKLTINVAKISFVVSAADKTVSVIDFLPTQLFVTLSLSVVCISLHLPISEVKYTFTLFQL